MADDVDDLLMGGGFGPAVKFDKVGDEHTMICTGAGQKYPALDYTTKQPKYFPSGDQIFAVKYPVAVDKEEKQHSLFVEKKELRVAIAGAIRAAGGTGLKFGDVIQVKRGPDGNKTNDRTHTFAAKFTPATDASRKRAQEVAGNTDDDEPSASASTSDPWATSKTDDIPF